MDSGERVSEGLLWRNECCSREGTIAIDDD
jgi:hypothetical protein